MVPGAVTATRLPAMSLMLLTGESGMRDDDAAVRAGRGRVRRPA